MRWGFSIIPQVGYISDSPERVAAARKLAASAMCPADISAHAALRALIPRLDRTCGGAVAGLTTQCCPRLRSHHAAHP